MPLNPRLTLNTRGADVDALHADLLKIGLKVPVTEREDKSFGVGTRDAIAKLQARAGLEPTGVVDEQTTAAVAAAAAAADAPKNTVQGRLLMEYGSAGAGVKVRAYTKGFGGAATLLGEVVADEQGYYNVGYVPAAGGGPLNIELRAGDPASNTEVTLTDPTFDAQKNETLDVVAPAHLKPAGPEFARLADDLKKHVGDLSKLAGAREDDGRQDLSVLHAATGWDAKLIAVASTAAALAPATGVAHEALYAALRAGLPADAAELALVAPADVEAALVRAREAGVTALSDADVAAAGTAFRTFAAAARLAVKSPATVNSAADFLAAAPLPSAAARDAFRDLYLAHEAAGTGAGNGNLWAAAAASPAIGPQVAATLRAQGKLAFLTQNNLKLTESLRGEFGSPDQLDKMVDKDLHTPAAWTARIGALAGNDPAALDALVPPAYGGKAGLDAYAEDLARKVRVSFPNRVTAKVVEAAAAVPARAQVSSFLRTATDFQLGKQPVNLYLKQRGDAAFAGLAAAERTAAVTGVKLVQRMHQIKPDDASLKVMLDLGFKSAHDVLAFDYDDFMKRFAARFPSRRHADLVYRRARQVAIAAYGFLTTAKQLDNAQPMFGTSGADDGRAEAKAALIRQFPTLESLFGSVDFCECNECGSVLSPAAYLVDLLKFLDPEDDRWAQFLADWPAAHGNQPYGPNPKKPYDVLAARRPDLPNLQLTCANTNTVLPYIDVVNEVLEAFVAKKLNAAAGFDTGGATTAELLAEPQNVERAAYDVLRGAGARYPLNLPFDLWHETVRAFFDYFDVPFARVLDLFRTSDELFPAPADAPYGRAAAHFESLSLSPAELAIFADPRPLDHWSDLYGIADKNEALPPAVPNALPGLRSAKALARQLGVSYKELADVLRTAFVNPDLDQLVLLRKLDVEPGDVFRFKRHPAYAAFAADEAAAFDARLTAVRTKYDFDALKGMNDAWDAGRFDKILVLFDADAGCNFEKTLVRRANGDSIDGFDLLKVNLFVRLWKKTGWPMLDLDRALQTLVPAGPGQLTAANIGPMLRTALVNLAHLDALHGRLNVGKDGRRRLLVLWADLPTTGQDPLYAQLFLAATVLKNDAVFDDPLGRYLTKDVPLAAHLPALQGATGLTADDVALVLREAGQDVAAAKLTVASASLLYRHGLLARALKLPVRDVLALKALTGLDPFARPAANPLDAGGADVLSAQTIAFVDAADKLKATRLRVDDADYLFRHRLDPAGKYRASAAADAGLARALADGIRRIRAEHAVPADASQFTDEVLQQTLALALPGDVAGTFFAMWSGTQQYDAAVDLPAALNPDAFAAERAITVDYDAVQKKLRLRFRGVLTDARKAALKALSPSPEFAALLDAAQQKARAFFDAHLRKLTARQPFGGFLDDGDFDLLFKPPADPADDATDADQKAARLANDALALQKRGVLANAFLPFLQDRLIRQFVVQTLAASLGAADPAVAEALLTEPALLAAPSGGGTVLAALTALAARGATASYFDAANNLKSTATTQDVTTAGASAEAQRVQICGHLEVPASGAYRFFVQFEKGGATAEFRLTDRPDPLLSATAAADGAEASEFLDLRAGVLHPFALDVTNRAGGGVRLLVQGESLPKGGLDRLTLYPRAAFDRAAASLVLLAKSLQLAAAVPLSEPELRHVLTHPGDFDGLSLTKLPTAADAAAAAVPPVQFTQFLRLADYAALKSDLGLGNGDLVDLFRLAGRAAPPQPSAAELTARVAELCTRFAELTRRAPATVQALAAHLKLRPADFASERALRRLWDAMVVVETMGAPAASVVAWANPAPDFAVASDLRNTIKARGDDEAWQKVGQPIFDALRRRKRDALVAHVLQTLKYDRVEQLFEHFLIDPATEPVVQTSRLRLAISSVQTFVQRCLLNLEPEVRPGALNAKHWEWMKRYRVWEANRKIFLFPENWLEPEFRDDKTFLFKELEGALLQGDVSDQLVEDAFFKYVQGLEEIARLQMVSMYVEEAPGDPESNTLHLVGRTFGQPHKYFYRSWRHEMWTPWEKVDAEVDGDHVAAIVWRGRLHLFWVTFLEKPQQPTGDAPIAVSESASPGKIANSAAEAIRPKEIHAQLHYSEFTQGKWAPRRSSPVFFTGLGTVKPFDPAGVFAHVSKATRADGGDGAAFVHLRFTGVDDIRPTRGLIFATLGLNGAERHSIVQHTFDRAFRVVSPNGPPTWVVGEPPPAHRYTAGEPEATRYAGLTALDVSFEWKITDVNGVVTESADKRTLLPRTVGGAELLFSNPLTMGDPDFRSVMGAFFLQDEDHTFFVQPSVAECTITQYESYTILPPPAISRPRFPDDGPIIPDFPYRDRLPIGPRGPIFDPRIKFELDDRRDWLLNPSTALEFNGRPVARAGGVMLDGAGPRLDAAVNRAIDGAADNVTPAPGADNRVAIGRDGNRLTIVGRAGMTPNLIRDLNASGALRANVARNLNLNLNPGRNG